MKYLWLPNCAFCIWHRPPIIKQPSASSLPPLFRREPQVFLDLFIHEYKHMGHLYRLWNGPAIIMISTQETRPTVRAEMENTSQETGPKKVKIDKRQKRFRLLKGFFTLEVKIMIYNRKIMILHAERWSSIAAVTSGPFSHDARQCPKQILQIAM